MALNTRIASATPSACTATTETGQQTEEEEEEEEKEEETSLLPIASSIHNPPPSPKHNRASLHGALRKRQQRARQ